MSLGAGKLKGIRRVRQVGKVYRYHRATSIRLPDDIIETDTDFVKAYVAPEDQASTGQKKTKRGAAPQNGTIAFAWWKFCKSDNFRDLSDGYQANLHRHGDAIVARAGKVPFTQIQEKHIQADIGDLPRNAARMRLKTWRALISFLKSKGDISTRQASMVEMPRPRKAKKHEIWSADHIKAFRGKRSIDTQQRLAMELMLFVGCRVSDAVRLGPGMSNRDGWLRFTQKKTGGEVEIPFNKGLSNFANTKAHGHLTATLNARTERHMTWLVTAYGSARSEKAVSNWFSKACRDAGLTADNRRTAHGLRGTCATRMAEGAAQALTR